MSQERGATPSGSTKQKKDIPLEMKMQTFSPTDKRENANGRHRICILSDDQGRGVCKQLSKLLGEKYRIFSEIKPGATADKILEGIQSKYSDFGKSDYILILTGNNDTSLMQLSSHLYYYLSQLINTNIIICEPCINKKLSLEKIKEMMKSLSKQLPHISYVDLRYSYLGLPRDSLRHLCQNILQEIIRIEYRCKLKHYKIKELQQLMRKSIQTQESSDSNLSTEPIQQEIKPVSQQVIEQHDDFFR